MTFMTDKEELKNGLIIFRRTDVQHDNWYCRMKLPEEDRYKTVSLKTSIVGEAREKAFDQDAELRFKIKHEIPVFNRAFSEVAKEFSDLQKVRAETGRITMHRWRVMDSHIRVALNAYVGTTQITLIGQDKWNDYPTWRLTNYKGRSGGLISDGTIRDEMTTFRSVMKYAAAKSYIRDSQVFTGKLPKSRARREEFTPDEYRKLHTFARKWVTEARNKTGTWFRTVTYNFILIMTNTGMRPTEARNLQWRDISVQSDRQGRQFVRLSVRGKGKHRNLVAPMSVAGYFERIKAISKATEDNDFVFTTDDGKIARTMYHSLIERLLKESKLRDSSSGSRRSTYCFRHTYATFRLTEGIDVLFLAKQMGTSVAMIENHYGHVTPVKNADRILSGLPGWEPIVVTPNAGSDNAPKDKGRVRKDRKAGPPRKRAGPGAPASSSGLPS
jgi:integrase